MTQASLYAIAAFAGFIAVLGVGSARANFYTIEGRFQCLDHADSSCVDTNEGEQKPKTPPSVAPSNPKAAQEALVPDPLLHAPTALISAEQSHGTPSPDPVVDIAARIETGKPSREDLGRLRTLSRSGDGRAIELLAWCDYAGIGLPRDPIAAYLMYGIAALAGISTASANQAVIYEYVLTPDQRQMVLDIQNDDIDPLPPP